MATPRTEVADLRPTTSDRTSPLEFPIRKAPRAFVSDSRVRTNDRIGGIKPVQNKRSINKRDCNRGQTLAKNISCEMRVSKAVGLGTNLSISYGGLDG